MEILRRYQARPVRMRGKRYLRQDWIKGKDLSENNTKKGREEICLKVIQDLSHKKCNYRESYVIKFSKCICSDFVFLG